MLIFEIIIKNIVDGVFVTLFLGVIIGIIVYAVALLSMSREIRNAVVNGMHRIIKQ